MIGEIKKDWKHFKESEPGSRFVERYRRRQEDKKGWADPSRLFNAIVGTVLVVGSAFFGWAPGPGMLTFVIGLGMIAGEFRLAARFLDWAEIQTRKFQRLITEVWHSSLLGKVLVVTTTLLLISTVAYIVCYLFFRG